MSIQRFPQQSPTLAPNASSDAQRQLQALYGTQQGYAELSYIEGDPRYKDLSRFCKVGYYQWPRQAGELLSDVAHYGAIYGNVYISSGLYGDKSRKHPLPSCIVFLDDAPAAPPLPYSMVVQTSAASRHAYYLLDQAVTPDERRDLQRRAAAASRSDASGADVEQIVRVAGTYNTKAHGRYPVALLDVDGPHYTLEQLCAAWPAVPEKRARTRRADDDSTSPALDTDLWQQAAPHLANIDALLASGRVACFKPTTQAARILAGDFITFIANGRPDASRSMNGCALAHGLRVRGFPDAEIAAVVYTLYQRWGLVGDKGSAWAQADVERCIAEAHAQYPDVAASPTRYQQRQPPAKPAHVIRKSRARSDRPQRLFGLDDVLLRLAALQDTPGKLCKDRPELARALGVSVPTLDRKLKPLRADGLVRWVDYNQRQESYLELSDAAQMMIVRLQMAQANTTPADVLSGPPADGIATRETAVTANGDTHGAPAAPAACIAPVVPDVPTPAEATQPTQGAGCVTPIASPEPLSCQDIDISRERGTITEQRMAAVYRALGELVCFIPRDEQQRTKRGDLECTQPDGSKVYREIKGEKQYPSRCAAIEFETIPTNAVAYGGASGPAESRADTLVYVNTTTGAWWELEIATLRALLPQWKECYRITEGKKNERDTDYGHAEYHTLCVLVPHTELARHAIASGIAPEHNPRAEAVRLAYNVVSGVEKLNEATGELRRQAVTLGRVLAALENAGHTSTADEVAPMLAAEREARKRAALLTSIADLKLNGLRATIRLAERLMEKSQEDGTGARRFWWVVAQKCKARMATLAPESQQQRQQRQKGSEAKPSPRKQGEQRQSELWQLADQALNERQTAPMPKPRTMQATAPANPYGPGYVAGMIARLKAAKEAGMAL